MDESDQSDAARFPFDAIYKALCCHRQRLDETIEEWRREAVTEGESRGATRQRALLQRQAAQRFGPETAERVRSLLDGVGDWDWLARAGESIIEADSGAELTRRIRAMIRGSS